ncbi:MAG TPA: hemolysin XhlA family protein [Niallia sp.]|nr:hemolysin XhlA family protein [Niallia sp.]
MENRVNKLENEVDDIKIRLAVAESNIEKVEQDISSIKDDTKWLRKTITTSIIGIVIACVLWVIKQGGV